MRSRPAPVSTQGFGSGASVASPDGVDRALELHEDEVPDLRPAEAVGRRLVAEAVVGYAARRVAVEPVDLGARTARAGLAHLPEVVAWQPGDAEDAVVAEAGDLAPDRARLVVGGDAVRAAEDGDDEALFGERRRPS